MGLVTSCSNEQEDIFGMSSAERLNEARKRYKNNFCDSENGWVMEYFPTTSSAGVNFIMKFEESEAVNIGTQNAYQKTYAEEVSLYEVLGDYGPVLSFNSYNNLFHLFSNPEDPEGSVSLDGLGLEGDYEFIIMNVDTDNGTAHLRGKKRATDIYMHKLAAGMKWEDYFVSVQQMNERLFNTGGIPVFLKKGDELLKISYNGSNGVFVMVDEGMDYIQGTPYSFIVTGSGIRMYQPVSADGKSQNFVPNAENNKLISVENPEIYFEAYNKASAYTESLKNKLWTVDTENCGPALQAKINELITYFANNKIGRAHV